MARVNPLTLLSSELYSPMLLAAVSFAPPGLVRVAHTHGLRRGLYSFAALRLAR